MLSVPLPQTKRQARTYFRALGKHNLKMLDYISCSHSVVVRTHDCNAGGPRFESQYFLLYFFSLFLRTSVAANVV